MLRSDWAFESSVQQENSFVLENSMAKWKLRSYAQKEHQFLYCFRMMVLYLTAETRVPLVERKKLTTKRDTQLRDKQ